VALRGHHHREIIMTKELLSRPFSMAYVLKTTAKHMRKSIDISIRKTFERVQDFDGNQEKSKEVFNTLSFLHQMRKQLDDFQQQNSTQFRESKEQQNDNLI
jgi:hypothetical protein